MLVKKKRKKKQALIYGLKKWGAPHFLLYRVFCFLARQLNKPAIENLCSAVISAEKLLSI